jgi:stage II sporulation protein P
MQEQAETGQEEDVQPTEVIPEADETLQSLAASEDSLWTKQVEINRSKLLDFDYLMQNFYRVDRTTTIDSSELNPQTLLAKDVQVSLDVEGPVVLIYHTHSQEGFADSDGSDEMSVMALGDRLSSLLQNMYGIPTMHHLGKYDVEGRDNAYANALPEVTRILEENPSIQVVIDLHRDGVEEGTRLVTEVNGKPTAKIMFFNGLSRTTATGNIDYLQNPYLQDNLALSLQMQIAAAELYPDFTRPVFLKGYRYNMHLCPKTMLIEVGAQTNTYEEVYNAMEPLANILSYVLLGNGS